MRVSKLDNPEQARELVNVLTAAETNVAAALGAAMSKQPSAAFQSVQRALLRLEQALTLLRPEPEEEKTE